MFSVLLLPRYLFKIPHCPVLVLIAIPWDIKRKIPLILFLSFWSTCLWSAGWLGISKVSQSFSISLIKWMHYCVMQRTLISRSWGSEWNGLCNHRCNITSYKCDRHNAQRRCFAESCSNLLVSWRLGYSGTRIATLMLHLANSVVAGREDL